MSQSKLLLGGGLIICKSVYSMGVLYPMRVLFSLGIIYSMREFYFMGAFVGYLKGLEVMAMINLLGKPCPLDISNSECARKKNQNINLTPCKPSNLDLYIHHVSKLFP